MWELPEWLKDRLALASDVDPEDTSARAQLARDGFFLPDPGQRWERHPAKDFPLWPANRRAFEFFTCELRTQWHHAGMDGVPTGLNMDGVRVIYETHFGKRFNREWLATLQLCESAALAAWSDERAAEAKKQKALAQP